MASLSPCGCWFATFNANCLLKTSMVLFDFPSAGSSISDVSIGKCQLVCGHILLVSVWEINQEYFNLTKTFEMNNHTFLWDFKVFDPETVLAACGSRYRSV